MAEKYRWKENGKWPIDTGGRKKQNKNKVNDVSASPTICDDLTFASKMTNQLKKSAEKFYGIFFKNVSLTTNGARLSIFLIAMTTSCIFFIIWFFRVIHSLPRTMTKEDRTKSVYLIGDVGTGKTASLQRLELEPDGTSGTSGAQSCPVPT